LRKLSIYKIKDNRGKLQAVWKNKKTLEQEESNNKYLPESVDKIIELQIISVSKEGRGYGKDLFNEFKKSKMYKEADAIYADINPFMGSGRNENRVMDKIEKIYKSWGFRNKHKWSRMWIFKNIEIKDGELPT